MRRILNGIALSIVMVCAPAVHAQEGQDAGATGQRTLIDIEREGVERIAEGQAVEETVGDINERNLELIQAYQAKLKILQGLEIYIGLLDRQLEGQTEEIELLQTSITDVAVIERQVLPLMLRMIDSLETFISLDVPFLQDERRERLEKLQQLMSRSDVTVAEKARRVFEAYQIENEYGRTIESYTAKLELEGASYDAEFLRIGRLGLLYRTVGSNQVGYWNSNSQSWQPLDRTPWNRMIEQGLKVARQEIAPQLIHVALDPQEVVSQ
jgi:hypothetical protein